MLAAEPAQDPLHKPSESLKQEHPPKTREPEKHAETEEDEESESDDGEDSYYQPAHYRKKSRKPPTNPSSRGRTRPRKNTADKSRLNASGASILKDTSSDVSITKSKILAQQLQKQTLLQSPEKRLFSFEEPNCSLQCLLCDFSVSVTPNHNQSTPAATVSTGSESAPTSTTTTTTTTPTSTSTTTTTTTSSAPSTTPRSQNSAAVSNQISNFQILFDELKFYETKKDQLLQHLLSEHSIVLADVDKLALLSRYLAYWKDKLKTVPLADIACEIHSQPNPSEPARKFWLMSSILPEDKELREKLVQQRLSKVIDQQQRERENDNFRKQCLFCSTSIQGTRQEILQHMFSVHYFNIGLADNMIFFTHFVDLLHHKIDSLQCVYCERIFKSISVLREHIRKKKHFKLNPDNTEYDCFYIANYLESGKGWQELAAEVDEGEESAGSQSAYSSFSESEPDISLVDDTEEWQDWSEELAEDCKCLFCPQVLKEPTFTYTHMAEFHSFDFLGLCTKWKLAFYDCVRLVNYIRSRVAGNQCPLCSLSFPTAYQLAQHLEKEKHYSVDRAASFWTDDDYLRPVLENDNLLCSIGGMEDSDDEENEEKEREKFLEMKQKFIQEAGMHWNEFSDDEDFEGRRSGRQTPEVPVARSLP